MEIIRGIWDMKFTIEPERVRHKKNPSTGERKSIYQMKKNPSTTGRKIYLPREEKSIYEGKKIHLPEKENPSTRGRKIHLHRKLRIERHFDTFCIIFDCA